MEDGARRAILQAVLENRNCQTFGGSSSRVTLLKWLGACEDELDVARSSEADEAAFPSSIAVEEVLVGRAEELDALLSQTLGAGRGIGAWTVVSGTTGGLGKSTLARAYCRAARPRYPMGVFWVNAASAVSLEHGFRAMALKRPFVVAQFEGVGANPEEARQAVLQWLSGNRGWLLVLDGADDLGLVERYVPRGSTGHVLITTRASKQELVDHKCVPLSAVEVALDTMGPRDSLIMVVSARLELASLDYKEAVHFLGGENSAECRAAQWLVGPEGVDGLAPALLQAGAYMRQQEIGFEQYVELFKARQLLLFKDQAVGAVGKNKSTQQVRASRLLSLFGMPAGVGSKDGRARRIVLTTWSMIRDRVALAPAGAAAVDTLALASFVAPDGVPVALLGLAGGPRGLQEYLGGAVEVYSDGSAGAASGVVNSGVEQVDMKPQHASSVGACADVLKLLRQYHLVTLAADRGTFSVHRLLQSVVLESMTADVSVVRECAVAACQGLIQGVAGAWSLRHSDWSKAVSDVQLWLPHGQHVHSAGILLDLCRQNGDEALAGTFASLLDKLTTSLCGIGWHVSALPLAVESLVLQRRLWAHVGGVHSHVATGLNNLSQVYLSLGRLEEALPLAEESLALHRRLWAHVDGVHSHVATGLSSLSQVYRSLGRLEEALPLAEESLELQRRLWAGVGGVHSDVATGLSSLSQVYWSLGRLEEALPLAEESLALERRLWAGVDGVHSDVARGLNNLCSVYKSLGRLEEALPLAVESLALHRMLWAGVGGVHSDVARGLNNLCSVYKSLGRLEEALSLAEESLALQRRLWVGVGGVHSDVARGLNNLSGVYRSLGRLEEALPLAEESLALERRLWAHVDGVHSDVAWGLSSLSQVYALLGRLEEALPLAEESLALKRRLWAHVDGVHSDVATGLNNLSQVYTSLGRLEEALPLVEEAACIARVVCAGLPPSAHGGLLRAVEENLRGVKERISSSPARGSGAQRQSAAADRLRRKLEARRRGK